MKIILCDIDGTVSDDIKNEDDHLYNDAKVLDGALEQNHKWYDEGHSVTFFTARSEKDRGVTIEWLDKFGFKYDGLIMDKPRCINDDDEYVWVDNRPVRGITYKGDWSELIYKKCDILVFK